jgi:hypothetical protein
LADYAAKGSSDPLAGLDSTLKVTWVVPGDPASPSDDRVIRLYSQVWHKAGQTAVTSWQLFTPAAPLAAGATPTAGTLVIETRSNPTSSKSRIRSTLVREFDAANDASIWSRTDHFENGDSAKSSGEGVLAGAGTYTQDLGRYARNSGYHDSKTGAFKDTLILLDFKGGEKSREIAWGAVDAEKGTGDYQVKRLGGRDTATAHIVVTADGAGFLLKRETADGAIEIAFHGDTASTARTFAGVRHAYAWTAAGGAYTVTQKDENTVTGAAVATGSYSFGQDLSGNGARTRTPAGKSPVEAKAQFQSDGTVYVDGIRVEPF